MRILYFGDPRAALALLESKSKHIQLCGIVHGRSGGEGAKKLGTVLRKDRNRSIPRWRLPNLSDSEVVKEIAKSQPDLIVSVFYPRLIPISILELAPGVNVHPSALPKWRGPDPAFWVIAQQELETAITIHRLSDQLDEGNIIYQEKVKVRPRESGGALAVRLERQAAQVMVDYLLTLAMNWKSVGILEGKAQIGEASWAPLMDPDELEVDWNKSVLEVDAFVRASAPDPCAFSGLGRELMVIHRGQVAKLSRPFSEAELNTMPIGQALIENQNCVIRCGQGFYQLDEVTIGRRRVKGKQLAQLLSGLN